MMNIVKYCMSLLQIVFALITKFFCVLSLILFSSTFKISCINFAKKIKVFIKAFSSEYT